MHLRTPLPSQRTRTALCAVAAACGLAASACSSSSGATSASSSAAATSTAASVASVAADTSASSEATSGSSSSATTGSSATGSATFLASDQVHEISMTFDDAAYQEMLSAFTSSGDKQWIEVTVTIDGTTYARAGARLKGNSSLRTLLGGGRGGFGGPGGQNAPTGAAAGDGTTDTTAAAAQSPQSLPWFIRLDKYVDGQNHDGVTDLIVRSNSTQTALNEAVALDLLRTAGLASEQAALVRFTANGSAADLRLVVENLNDEWDAGNFDGDGILYKAESTGDYSYRGTDPAAYEDVFDQETGDDDLTPLIGFLDFVNNSDDATFAADLAKHLDVDSFATYLAFEELVDNFDDIDGPGNNSYLRWDASTGVMTVVAWDHNLAFGSTPGGPGGAGGPGGGGGFPPGGGQFPPNGQRGQGGQSGEGAAPGGFPDGGGGGGRGPMGRSNPLVNRFTAVPEFQAEVDAAKTALTEKLYTGGAATASLTRWSDLISSQAADLVDSATLQSEKASIEKYVK